MLTTDQKGAIAEAAVVLAASKLGLGVYRPLMEGGRYDLVLEVGSRLLRTQCKWATLTRGTVIVRCYSSRRGRECMIVRKYTSEEIDVMTAYCAANDSLYLLMAHDFVDRREVRLRVAPCLNNQRVGINWAGDFDFEARLRALVGP